MSEISRGRPKSADPLARALAVRFTVSEEALVREAAGTTPLARWIRERAVEAARAAVADE